MEGESSASANSSSSARASVEEADEKVMKESSLILDIPTQACYAGGAEYWSKVDATVDGMLGGLGNLDRIDIQASERFLKLILKVSNHIFYVYNSMNFMN